MNDGAAIVRGLTLGAISGLKATYGPALLAASRRSKGWEALALAAAAEMVLDKQPLIPRRSSAVGMLPRALAGFWAARSSMERPGESRYDPRALDVALAGAAAAAGVAYFAPSVREALRRTLGVPDLVIGIAEDALALGVGSAAVGLAPSELADVGEAVYEQVRKGRVAPAVHALKDRLLPI